MLFSFLNLKHGNYFNNYTGTMGHKSTATKSRGSHFLKEPISTDKAKLNLKYTRAYTMSRKPRVFIELIRGGRGNKQTNPTNKKTQKPTPKNPPHQTTKFFKSGIHRATIHSIICSPHKTLPKAFCNSTHLKNISWYLFFSKRQVLLYHSWYLLTNN